MNQLSLILVTVSIYPLLYLLQVSLTIRLLKLTKNLLTFRCIAVIYTQRETTFTSLHYTNNTMK